MICPACERPLRRFKAGTVTLDGCHGGCGGIWFDYGELAKVNREHPDADAKIADIARDPAVKTDDYDERRCPKCAGVILDKKLYSLGSGVVMDCCPKCKGVWLDHGELEKIRAALHPRPRPRRAVVREAPPANVAVGFEVIQQVQILHLGSRA